MVYRQFKSPLRRAFYIGDGMNIEQLRNRLASYLECEAAILRGASYRIGDRELRRADLSEVRKAISALEDEIAFKERGGRRIARAVFID